MDNDLPKKDTNYNELLKLVFLLSMFLICIVIDLNTRLKYCKNINTDVILLILSHRLIYVFLMLGWIFNNKIILIFYILFICSINIHWIVNEWKCDLTQKENKICEYTEYKYFDYIYLIFTEKIADVIQIFLMILFLIISFIKLCFV